MPPTDRSTLDPYGSFRFQVECDGVIEAAFQSVSGLSAQIEVVAQKEGGLNTHVHQLKGTATYTPIVLKRGMTKSKTFYTEMSGTIADPSHPRMATVTITLFHENGKEAVQTWTVRRAWVSKWEAGNFDTSSSAALIETLEITHEGFLE